MTTPEATALIACIGDTLRNILAQQGKPAPASVDADTALFGRGGWLDSMGLVTLVVEVEQVLAEQFGLPITLADDRAMSQRSSPFRTVGTLVAYILSYEPPPSTH
jgi:acyl carrier protein